jgi:hypothetical protein
MTRDEELRRTSRMIQSHCAELQVIFSELKWRIAEVKNRIDSTTERLGLMAAEQDRAAERQIVVTILQSSYRFPPETVTWYCDGSSNRKKYHY